MKLLLKCIMQEEHILRCLSKQKGKIPSSINVSCSPNITQLTL